jgi:hypothetical protein
MSAAGRTLRGLLAATLLLLSGPAAAGWMDGITES